MRSSKIKIVYWLKIRRTKTTGTVTLHIADSENNHLADSLIMNIMKVAVVHLWEESLKTKNIDGFLYRIQTGRTLNGKDESSNNFSTVVLSIIELVDKLARVWSKFNIRF